MRLVFLIISLLILSSCQSNENIEKTDDNTKKTVVETSGENSNNKESEEKNNNERVDTNESSEESANSENQKDGKNATLFDIHSDEVKKILFSSNSVKENHLTFSQDVITQGMSQTEVEEHYGTYDLIYQGHGGPVVIYGNLGVNYSKTLPYGTNDEQADKDINPDKNIVEDVKFYAGLPYDEVVDALGAPDVDVYETKGGPMSGLQLMEYVIEDKKNSTITGTFWLHDNESGEKIVDLMTVDEVPDDAEDITAYHSKEAEDIDSKNKERLELFINGYIEDLMGYYNNGDKDILSRTRETSPNYKKISTNNASRNYINHETYELDIIDIKAVEENVYEITVSREYSHATSNGRNITEVEYSIVETPQGFMIHDYQELNNESIE